MKLLPLLILIFAFTAYGQEQCAMVESGADEITRISKINADIGAVKTCRIVTYTGTIYSVNLDLPLKENIASMTIQMANGRRKKIYVHDDEVLSCLSVMNWRSWRRQMRKGVRVKVEAWNCAGGENADLSIESIEFLPAAKKK